MGLRGTWIIDVKAPENGIELNVLFDEEVVDVIPDDVVVETTLPDGMLNDFAFACLSRYRSLECAHDRFKGIRRDMLKPRWPLPRVLQGLNIFNPYRITFDNNGMIFHNDYPMHMGRPHLKHGTQTIGIMIESRVRVNYP